MILVAFQAPAAGIPQVSERTEAAFSGKNFLFLHLVSDGWGSTALMQDVSTFFKAAFREKNSCKSDLPPAVRPECAGKPGIEATWDFIAACFSTCTTIYVEAFQEFWPPMGTPV